MNKRYMELVALYLEGGAAVQDRDELLSLVRADRKTADDFIGQIHRHGQMQIRFEDPAIQRESEERILFFLKAVASDEFVDRLHARVHETPVRKLVRRFSWFAPLAAAAAVLGALGVWWMAGSPSSPPRAGGPVVARVTEVARGKWHVAGKAWTELVVGDEVRAGTRIEVAKGGTAVLVYPGEDTRVTAGSEKRETRITIGAGKEGKRLHIERGLVTAKVAPQPADKRFVLTTPHARVRVVGTKFSLSVIAHRSRLMVDEGRVASASLDKPGAGIVGAGQYCDVCPAASGIFVLPKEALAWRPGRVLWSTDYESEKMNRDWEVYVMSVVRGAHSLAPLGEREKALRFERRRLGERDSTVMIVDASILETLTRKRGDFLGLAVVHPRVHAIMTGRSHTLAYDEYVMPGPKQGHSTLGTAEKGVWRHVEINVLTTSAGMVMRVYVNGCLEKGGVVHNPRDLQWLLQFVFAYLRKEMIVDNLSVREFVRETGATHSVDE